MLLRLNTYDLTSNFRIYFFPLKFQRTTHKKQLNYLKCFKTMSLRQSNDLSTMLCHQSFLVQCIISAYWELLAFEVYSIQKLRQECLLSLTDELNGANPWKKNCLIVSSTIKFYLKFNMRGKVIQFYILIHSWKCVEMQFIGNVWRISTQVRK